MSPVTSFTTSLGHDGRIDIFALSDSQGVGATVWRIRQKAAGGDWSPAWIQEENPSSGPTKCEASSTLRNMDMS